MPKISDEFKPQPATPAVAKPVARAPQPVTKPAPMAPRVQTAKPVVAATSSPEPRRAPEARNGDALADKLRAQRAAAEKLAEQRVSAARERAEARVNVEPSLPMPRAQPADTAPKAAPAAASRPKFSFAEDGQTPPRRESGLTSEKAVNGLQRPAGASLIPPRPALGGERSQSSLLRPASFRPDALPAFRPIDPATGYAPQSARPAPLGGQRAYPQEPPGLAYGSSRMPARKPAYDPYRRGPEAAPHEAETQTDEVRGDPRLGRSVAARGSPARAPESGHDDVFEDEAPPPRRRASASEYQSAYREAEEGETDDRRRSSGPWLLLLALLAAALATGGVVWFYNTKMKTVATTSTTTDTVPVIAAPEQPAKTAAETPADGAGDAAAVSKKQIYDRIVGDREVTGGTVVPTEVTPIQPEAVQPDQSGANQIPQPGGTADQGQGQGTEDALPLPLPPAPGQDIQGKVDQATDQQVVATAAAPAVADVKTQATTAQGGENIASLLAASGTDDGAADNTQASPPSTKQPATADTTNSTTQGTTNAGNPTAAPALAAATDTSSAESVDSGSAASSASVEPDVQTPPSAKKKTTAAKKITTRKKPAAGDTAALGAEPVVLVPPSEIAAPSQQTAGSATAPATETAKQPAARKKTIFDLFNRNSGSTNAPSQAGAPKETVTIEPAPEQQQSPGTKVASLPSTAASGGGSGYVVQLASFRSQGEAQTEYGRLRSKYPSIMGTMAPNISQVLIGGSTRFRLGLGPMTARDQATRVCSQLFAAGERDCLVRKQ